MQAVILGGGKGTRLATTGPKPLVEVGGKPFLRYLLAELRRFGIVDIVVLTGPFADAYRARLGDGSQFGVRLTYVAEPDPAGTGGALTYAARHLAPEFLLLNGDSFFDINLVDLMTRTFSPGWLIGLALREVEDVARYGAVGLDGDKVTAFGEKAVAGPGIINAGIYRLRREAVAELGPPPVSLEKDTLPRLVARGQVRGVVYPGRFIDIGVPDDLARARTLMPSWERRPAAFLDRDGVLNRDHGYVHKSEDFEWLPGAREAVKRLNDAGYLAIVVSNQAGIARGLYATEDVEKLHRWINGELAKTGAHMDAFYYCPHHPTEGIGKYRRVCDCRKPAPGMLLHAIREWPIESPASFMIGDKDIDMQAAAAAGIRGIHFSGGNLDALIGAILASQARRGQ
ncbi:MAG TPA: D-glycero-beta-D-manno-heptose 1,7-bisphosphate 7-phosphatase [Stellaceae bacterium]|nr:D-glycero-beta-D-manno-heptose 1,7-bisphosphate 7-phosphatase [Stellaceae bacterium]